MIIQIVIKFFDYGTLVNIKYVIEEDSEFPAVTFCNLNPFKYAKNSSLEQYVYDLYMQRLDSSSRESPNVRRNLCNRFMYGFIGTMLLREREELIKNNNYYTIDDMLLSCYFNQEKCTKEDFVQISTTLYGYCYIFNYKRFANRTGVRRTTKPGMLYGLQM